MVAFTLTNIPAFMGALLSYDTFDAFGVHEITIKNGFNLIIEEGQMPAGPADGNGPGAADPAADPAKDAVKKPVRKLLYGRVRSLCFDAVKGKTLPEFMRFILTAPEGTAERLSGPDRNTFDPANVISLALNITYKDGKLTVTSGSSVKDIFAGKAADMAWGEEVKRLFAPFGIEE